MRHLPVATLAFAALIFDPHVAMSDQTFIIQNYPVDQNGATLSGTITTDGVIGNLVPSDILSWTWTITPIDGTPFTLDSSTPGALTELGGDIVESQSTITIASSIYPNENYLSLVSNTEGDLSYYRYGPFNGYYALPPNSSTFLWNTSDPLMGGTNPWVIAAVSTYVPPPSSSIPEPPSIILAVLGIACCVAYGRKLNPIPGLGVMARS